MRSPCNCRSQKLAVTSREVIVYLFRIRVSDPFVKRPLYKCDFHALGRNPCNLPNFWSSKGGSGPQIYYISNPDLSTAITYPQYFRLSNGELPTVLKGCFCCDTSKMDYAIDIFTTNQSVLPIIPK